MNSNPPDKENQDRTIIEREDKTIVENDIKRRESTDGVIDDNEITIRELEDRTGIEKDKTVIESSDSAVEQRKETVAGSEISSFRNYPILEQFPATGGEADIYLIKQKDKEAILKLYRYGMDPKENVLKKAKELSYKFPEHIIEICEYGYDGKTNKWYEIQEYAKFGSLRDYINAGSGKKELKTIIEEIAEGLKVLNDNNLLHLDLKPSNILIRSIEPLDLIFTDFGIASILDPELSKKMTKIKGTPLYWSPESFTGVVGKEADYWSLGMIILEMFAGKHPFSGLDTKIIMYTLSTKGVGIPNDMPEEYQLLLKGLLTREPDKRWSYAEVRRWLNGEKDIPVYFSEAHYKEGDYEKPYKFHNKKYHSLKELVTAFVKSEDSWKDAVAHINRGYVTKWLENNEDYDKSVMIEKIREEAGGDNDYILVKLIYTFNKQLPFIFHGKLITIQNIHFYAGKTLKKENTKGEGDVIDALLKGKLTWYYNVYLNASAKAMEDLSEVLSALNRTIPSEKEYSAKLTKIYKVLDFLSNLDQYVLPSDISENPYAKLDFIIGNLELFMTKDEYEELINKYIIPDVIKNALVKGLSSQYIDKVKHLLQMHKDNVVLAKDEFKALKEQYVIPFLPDDINSLMKELTTQYDDLVRIIRTYQENNVLMTKKEYDDLMSNYILPEELKNELRDDEPAKYKKAVKFIKTYQKDYLLLSKNEYEELKSEYLIPEELKNDLASDKITIFEGAFRCLRNFQKNNFLLSLKEFKNLINDYVIPDELKNQFNSERTYIYGEAVKQLRDLDNHYHLIKKDRYDELINIYLIPEELRTDLLSKECSKYKKAASRLVELERLFQHGTLLLKNSEYEQLVNQYFIPKEIIDGLSSNQYDKYKNASRKLRVLQYHKLIIKKEDYQQLKKKYIIPSYIKAGLYSERLNDYREAVGALLAQQKGHSLPTKTSRYVIYIIVFIICSALVIMTVYRVQKDEQRRQKLSSNVESQAMSIAFVSKNNVVRVRSGPSTNAIIIAKINEGDKFNILRTNEDWLEGKFRIGNEERVGWIHKSLVTIDSASSQETSKSSAFQETPISYVIDRAGIIKDDVEASLDKYLIDLEQKTTARMDILTIKSLEGESIEDYSTRIAHDKWKLGEKGKNNGVLLLVSLQDRKYRFEIGYGLEGALPDSLVGSIGREFLVPYFKKGDYSKGIATAAFVVINKIVTDAGVEIKGMPIPR